MTDLAAERWARRDDPATFQPRDALVEALRRLDAGELPAEHVVVCVGLPGDKLNYLQAGPYSTNAMVGLVARVLRRLER